MEKEKHSEKGSNTKSFFVDQPTTRERRTREEDKRAVTEITTFAVIEQL